MECFEKLQSKSISSIPESKKSLKSVRADNMRFSMSQPEASRETNKNRHHYFDFLSDISFYEK